MSFLNPILLLGLTGIAAPILIHLLNRRQIKRVPWAAMRFLRQSIENNQKRLRLEDLILLLLRVLLIILLAVTLARPSLNPGLGSAWQTPVVCLILIDDSYSMTQINGATSRFDQAKRAAMQVIESLPPGSSAAIWLVADNVRPIVPDPSRDLAVVRRLIHDLKPSDRSTDLLPGLRQGVQMLQRHQNSRREIYLITDAQALGFQQVDAIQQLLESSKSEIRTSILQIDQPEDENLGVSSLIQFAGVPVAGRPLRFSATVTNYGLKPAANIRINLKISASNPTEQATDASAPVDDATIDLIKPGESKTVFLFGRLKNEGYYAVTASIQPDRVPADDTRSILVRAIGRTRVLLVDGEKGIEARDDETFFLRNALAASGAVGLSSLVEFTLTDPDMLVSERLENYDTVILANVADLSENTLDALARYVKDGGGMLIFSGNNVKAEKYQRMFGQRGLLPVDFGQAMGNERSENQLTTFSDSSLDHPLVSLWKDAANGKLGSVRIYKYVPLAPVSPADPVNPVPQVVLRLLDGTPISVECKVGEGQVLIFGLTADSSWSDLPVRPGIYIPLLYRCLGRILENRDQSLRLSVGQPLNYSFPFETLGKEAEIRSITDPEVLPEFRRIELQNKQATLRTDPIERAGIYGVRADGIDPAMFVVQADPQESLMDTVSDLVRNRLKDHLRWVTLRDDFDLTQDLKHQESGRELFLPLMMIVLLLVVVESVLAMWFSRSK